MKRLLGTLSLLILAFLIPISAQAGESPSQKTLVIQGGP